MALDNKDPSEKVVVTFDFSAVASSVSAATVTCEHKNGPADASPLSMISGSATVSGAQVLQLVVGGQAGTDYNLRCQVDAGSERFVLADTLKVKTANAAA
jgi:hypothetical protein